MDGILPSRRGNAVAEMLDDRYLTITFGKWHELMNKLDDIGLINDLFSFSRWIGSKSLQRYQCLGYFHQLVGTELCRPALLLVWIIHRGHCWGVYCLRDSLPHHLLLTVEVWSLPPMACHAYSF
jgi:hypothetical protein